MQEGCGTWTKLLLCIQSNGQSFRLDRQSLIPAETPSGSHANSGEIIAHSLTDQNTGDPSQMAPLLGQIEGEVDQFSADRAYDGDPIYTFVLRRSAGAKIVTPPRLTAVARETVGGPGQREDRRAAAGLLIRRSVD